MELHGVQWNFMENLWNPMGDPWNSMEFHGRSMELHGIRWNFIQILCKFMKFHGTSMDFHGTLIELHGEINIPFKVIMHGQCQFYENQRISRLYYLLKRLHSAIDTSLEKKIERPLAV